jgi:hypothetical protein
MKSKLLLLILILAFSGCASVPSEVASQLDRAYEKYSMVTKDMTKQAIIASLGPPQKEEGSTLTWEVRYCMKNYASFVVEFDRTGQSIKTELKYSRWSSNFVGSIGHSHSVVK